MPQSLSKMRSPGNEIVMGLMDIPTIVSVCKQQGIILNKMTRIELLSSLLKSIGPYFGYELIQHMIRKGVNNWGSEDFEVEKILHHAKEKGVDYFLIKWKGWSPAFNSWEARENLGNCRELLEAYEKEFSSRGVRSKEEEDKEIKKCVQTREEQLATILEFLMERYHDNLLEDFLLAVSEIKKIHWLLRVRRTKMSFLSKFNKYSKVHRAHTKELIETFASWETRMNSDPNAAPIHIENKVDLEGLPMDFVYISKRFHSGDVAVDGEESRKGCQCEEDKCSTRLKSCRCVIACYGLAYTKAKRLRISEGQAIYECNKNCSCDETCQNRVVQLGRKVPLCLFRTQNGRGWGVKSACKIRKGTFVEEYVGEVITSEEAERRGQIYDVEGLTYLFDLDFHERDCAFTIDAKTYGNISHFINHSCNPNLAVFNVWIDSHDERLPRIALFAVRDISANEELTFDYKMNIENSAPLSPDDDSMHLNDTTIEEEEVPGNEKKDELTLPSRLETLQNLQTVLTEHPVLPLLSDSGSPKSLAEPDLPETLEQNGTESPKLSPEQELRIVLCKMLLPSSAQNDLNMGTFKSDTPSASSVSVPDLSLAGGSLPSEDPNRAPGRILPPRKAKMKAIKEGKRLLTSAIRSNLASLYIPPKLSICKLLKKARASRSDSWSEPPLKRMRIPCNCGAANCRKWLC